MFYPKKLGYTPENWGKSGVTPKIWGAPQKFGVTHHMVPTSHTTHNKKTFIYITVTVWTFRCIVCVCDYVGDKKYPEPARTHIENIRIFERPCSTPKKSQKSGVPQKFGVVFLHFSLQKIGILQPQNSGVPQNFGVTPEIWGTPEFWGTPNTPKTSFLKNQRKNAPRTFQTSK